MLILLSPTKKQQATVEVISEKTTTPQLQHEANYLVNLLKKYSKNELAKLMKISDSLAKDTYEKFQKFDNNPACSAILAFQGDAFKNLQASDFSPGDFSYAQKHLIILSGLYGYLRPLDLIKNYRLEMDTKLCSQHTKNLYEFWKGKVTDGINRELEKLKNQMIINLASDEYFNVINTKQLTVPVITIAFKEYKNNAYKTVGTYAKRARGLMARYIIKNKIENIAEIKQFDQMDYQYSEKLSSDALFVFVRNN